MIVDPRLRPYRPKGGAKLLFYDKSKEVLIEGPSGTGKTRGVLEKIHICLCKYAGARALAARKTRKSMTDSVLVTYETKVIPDGHSILDGPSRAMRHEYRYPNGSVLVIGGMDDASKIMSTEYDIIAVFEATETTEDDWEKLTTRLRNGVMPYQQIMGDCNPAYPDHWLNQRASSGRMSRILSRHEDNPSVTQEYLSTLATLTGARRERLFVGKWVAQEGVVYEGFDAKIHLIDRFEIPKDWPRYLSIDFGYTNPFVCQWWAKDPDGRIYRYREIYRTKRIVEDHAKHILALSKGERIESSVADHDAEDRATLERHEILTLPATKDISRGIQAVTARIGKAGDGKPRIFFLRDSLVEADPSLIASKKPTCSDAEFDAYVWPKGSDGKPKKEVPVDDMNHGMDAMRYMTMLLDGGDESPSPCIF